MDSRALNPARARQLIATVVAAPEDAGALAQQALEFLESQLAELERLANGFPWTSEGMQADVWYEGRDLAGLSDTLADPLAARGMAAAEHAASRLALGFSWPTMHASSDVMYRRILRHSRCCEAIGALRAAIHGYEVIVDHWRSIERDGLIEAGPLPEDFFSMANDAVTALQRLIVLQPANATRSNQLLAKLQGLLARGMGPEA